MSVRKTESELPPANFAVLAGDRVSPTDLGQAVADTSGNYVLISYLTSPLMPESRNDYVVFALNGARADAYHWVIMDADARDLNSEDEIIDSQDTDEGIFKWTTPDDEEGEYVVSVQIRGSGLPADPVLRLYQSVRPINPGEGLEGMFSQELNAAGLSSPFGFIRDLLKRVAYAGEWDSTSELLFELWGYIFDASNATDLYGIPTRLLAAVLYQHLLTHPKDFELTRPIRVGPGLRSTEIAWAARELNDEEFIPLSTESDNALGVAQIRPETAAMVLGCVGAPWTDKPSDPAERDVVDKQIHNRYLALSESVRIGLFNMLRFPRSNIAVAAKLLARLKNRSHRWPAVRQESLIANSHAVEIIATEYLIGALNTPANTAKANDFGRAVAKTVVAPFIVPFFPAHVTTDVASRFLADPAMTLAYDGKDYAQGDNDAHVADARTHLDGLGIGIGAERPPVDPRDFDLTMEFAIREFQVYAKVGYVAFETIPPPPGSARLDRLRSYPNLYRYGGPISGVLNLETRRRMQAWRASNWRCPVIVQALTRDGAGNFTAINRDNIWLHDIVASGAPRMFFRDFSRYYSYPATRPVTNRQPLGDWRAGVPGFSGPTSVPPIHTWNPEAEILPDTLVKDKATLATLSRSERATFKVVRAASEVECQGFFDCLNCNDNAFVSLGPCHWTLGIVNGAVDEGELVGYLAYLRYADPKAFARAISFFGLRSDEDWKSAAGANGQNLHKWDRKFAGWVAQQNDQSVWVRMPLAQLEGNYFKNWHWFFRFVMAGRTIGGYRRRMWDMARIRLRDVLSTPWGVTGANDIPDMEDRVWGGTRSVTIGDVFTSERAVALLLRWHIRYPRFLIARIPPPVAPVRHCAHDNLRRAFANAAIPAGIDPNDWNDVHEAALVAGIISEVNSRMPTAAQPFRYASNFRTTMSEVNDWPQWIQPPNPNPRGYRLSANANRTRDDEVGDMDVRQLSTRRNSFKDNFDRRGLPDPPDYRFFTT